MTSSKSPVRAAVYAGGRVATGANHGDAYSNLPPELRGGNDFLIGMWDPRTGRFVGDGEDFYTKEVLLIRHGEPYCTYDRDIDPGLSIDGIRTVGVVGDGLVGDWSGCPLFCSPFRRCLITASIIGKRLRARVTVDPALADSQPPDARLPRRQTDYPDFRYLGEGNYYHITPETAAESTSRIRRVLESLPARSIVISHCNFIRNVSQLIDENMGSAAIVPASMTLIRNRQVVYLGNGVPQDETFRRN